MTNDKKTHYLTCRADENQYEIIRNKVKSSGKSLQAFYLNALLETDIINTQDFANVAVQIRSLGVNLNQIARKLNQNSYIDFDRLTTLINEGEELCQQLKLLIAKHR